MDSLAAQAAAALVLRDKALGIVEQELKQLFDDHSDLDSVSYLNSSTYNDQAYEMPSNYDDDYPGHSLVVINDCDYTQVDSWNQKGEPRLNELTQLARYFYDNNVKHFGLLFGDWAEIRIERAKDTWDEDRSDLISVTIYERYGN